MLILASQSQTRKALLTQAGLRFEAVPALLDERLVEREAEGDGQGVATLLAQRKALAVSRLRPEAWVIGADQTLMLDEELFYKPDDMAAARGQLDRLAGKTHQLHAAVSLARGDCIVWSTLETAELTMRAFTATERESILMREGEALLGSVGAYRLEGPSIQLFEQVRGDYFTILGLPLLPLLAALRRLAPELL